MKEIKETLMISLSVSISAFMIMATLFIVLTSFLSALEYGSCNNYAELNSSYQVEYRWPAGCMVKMDDIWLRTDKVYHDTTKIVVEDE